MFHQHVFVILLLVILMSPLINIRPTSLEILSWPLTLLSGQVSFSAALRMPVLSSPIKGIFLPPAGEYSYALFTLALIGRGKAQAGNRLNAGVTHTNAAAGNQWPYHNMITEKVLGQRESTCRLAKYLLSGSFLGLKKDTSITKFVHPLWLVLYIYYTLV